MIKTDKEYIQWWVALSPSDKMRESDLIQKKWDGYKSMGYEVSTFLSGTFISDSNGVPIYASRTPISHFLKSIDFMDIYIKNLEM
jgi:hypothetical protein